MQTSKLLFPQPSLDMKRYTQTYFSDSDEDIFISTNNSTNNSISIKKDTVIEDNKNLEYWLGFTNCW